jgi:non-ribosomal peptide synthetase component F
MGLIYPSAFSTRDPTAWSPLLRARDVTIWNSAPALMQLLLDSVDVVSDCVACLRAVLLSGDWIPLSLPAPCLFEE